MPILTGSMEPDVRFFGFDIAAAEIGDWSIVIAEQPTAPRFGIEVADVPEPPPAPTTCRSPRATATPPSSPPACASSRCG